MINSINKCNIHCCLIINIMNICPHKHIESLSFLLLNLSHSIVVLHLLQYSSGLNTTSGCLYSTHSGSGSQFTCLTVDHLFLQHIVLVCERALVSLLWPIMRCIAPYVVERCCCRTFPGLTWQVFVLHKSESFPAIVLCVFCTWAL